MKIYKYPIERTGLTAEMPEGARIVSCQFQDGAISLWAIVDPDAPLYRRSFRVVGTGQDVAPNWTHIATLQQGSFVWHVFMDSQ